MYIRDNDEEPLIPPTNQTFVRRGAFRISTRYPRHSSLAIHKANNNLQGHQNSFTGTDDNQPFRTIEDPLGKTSEGSHTFRPQPPSRNDRIDYLPPLPPSRTYDESSHKLNPDGLKKPQALQQHRNDLVSRGPVPHAQNQRSSSPLPNSTTLITQVHEPFKHTQSLPAGTQNLSHRTSPVPNIESASQLQQDFTTAQHQNTTDVPKNRDHVQAKESWNQRIFSALRRPSSPSPSPNRKKTPPAIHDIGKHAQFLHSGNDSRKGFSSLFKRSSSPALFRSTTPVEDKNNQEAPKVLQPQVGSALGQAALVVYRNSSLPIHSLTPQPSPITYRRDHSTSDPLLEANFKRHGSFPLQRKQVCHTNSRVVSYIREKEPDMDHTRLSRPVSFRRPTSPVISSNDGDNTSSGESSSDGRKSILQIQETNCFALLPTSRPNFISEDIFHDHNTVRLPIQLDSKYDNNRMRRRTTQLTNITPKSVSTFDKEDNKSSFQSYRTDLLQRTKSLPVTRRKEMDVIFPYGTNGLSEDPEAARELRSQSLNVPVNRPLKFTTNLQQTQESVTEHQVSSSSSTGISSHDSYGGSTKFHDTSPVSYSTDEHRTVSKELSRCNSSCSSVSGPDISEWFDNNSNHLEEPPKKIQSNADHVAYLLENDEEYISCLAGMLHIYDQMCRKTPPHIRQHFDVIFKHLGFIHEFHTELHAAIKRAGTNLLAIADVFTNEQFQCYSHYMIMTPTVQKDFYRYSNYFDEQFPSLKRDFLKPSIRINFYSMMLDGLKKAATQDEKKRLQTAIDYLSNLKLQANTEMTITSVVNSPVDLRLCGNMLMIGDVFCSGAGPLQKRKYHIILFENILMITSSKLSFFKYKMHYRIEQLEAVKPVEDDDCEFCLKVLTEGQVNVINFKFKVRITSQRNQWIKELQNVISQTKLQCSRENIKSVLSPINSSQLLPLSLYKVYPNLLKVMTQDDDVRTQTKIMSNETLCHQLIAQEKIYIRQISSLLNPEAIMPPESLCTLLEKFHQLHNKQLLPELERAQHKSVQEMLVCIQEHLNMFHIYSDYFVVRCQLNSELERTTEASLYISPIQHFTFHMTWLKQVSQNTKYKSMAMHTLQRFKEYILHAQVRLLTESIKQGKIDFYRSGNLLRNDTMEVKTRQKGVHEGLYQVLLFEKIIVLTKAKRPFYEYSWDIWLNQINLGPPSSSERGFKLEVRQGRGKEAVTFEFRASSTVIQQIWIKTLQKELIHQAEDIRKRTAAYHL